METIENLPTCTIVMETCGGANHWCRRAVKLSIVNHNFQCHLRFKKLRLNLVFLVTLKRSTALVFHGVLYTLAV